VLRTSAFINICYMRPSAAAAPHSAGLVPLPVSPEESFTQGFDNLAARCAAYKAAGASFAKWRAVINIRQASAASPGLPSEAAVAAAARGLAMYAAISQSAGLVPIVEPEVLADGDHGIELCEAVTQRVLAAVFKELADAGGCSLWCAVC
jgi:fructose-bisphosphate aldolase class I